MKKYIIDNSVPFEGFTLFITNEQGLIEIGWGTNTKRYTLEEYKEHISNPNLIAITAEELTQKHTELRASYMTAFTEIDEEEYYRLFHVLPPLYFYSDTYFMTGGCYAYDLYPFCFTQNERYFKALRSSHTDPNTLYREAMEFCQKNNI